MRDTDYYNRESVRYSDMRYAAKPSSYLQHFYARRLAIVQEYIVASVPTPVKLLEIGCADGVVIRALERAFPEKFSAVQGVDISEEMIAEAQRRNQSTKTTFLLRSALPQDEQFDLVIEVGVVNYASVDEEIRRACAHMHASSQYILSVAGTDSLKNRLKGEDGFQDFRSYRVYEPLIKEFYDIERVVGCGVFVPYLWRLPALARIVMPFVEALVNAIGLRHLCHEQVYLLKIKKR